MGSCSSIEELKYSVAREVAEKLWRNSQIFYIVTRSEEHDDYVEKLLNDEQNAIDYCNKFKDSPDEYARHYYSIELSL